MLQLHDFEAAHQRIQPYIRRTPILPVSRVQQRPTELGQLFLKLECLQVTGAFKARGALSKLLSFQAKEMQRGIVTASGGNHGVAVAYAGWVAQVPTWIYLPTSAPPAKGEKLKKWGAQVIWEGETWDDANRAALHQAEMENLAYIHAFGDPAVIAGQGTISLEILEQLPQVETLIVAIGGGGLISGVATAAKLLKPSLRIIGVEPVGAPTLLRSLEAGSVIQLPSVQTLANTLAPRQTTQLNFEMVYRGVDQIVLVSDEDMRQAAQWLWFEMGVGAELSGAAAIAALLTQKIQVSPSETVCALVCGAGLDGISEVEVQHLALAQSS
jgi:threonine dehydratase